MGTDWLRRGCGLSLAGLCSALARLRMADSIGDFNPGMRGQSKQAVVGIDVGGERKGFHAVALLGGIVLDKKTDPDPKVIVDWCLDHKAMVVAVDAPCRWSQSGSSRLAEQKLELRGKKIYCFSTPTRARALHRNFYKWVFNGERLYRLLAAQYVLFSGQWANRPMCIETFPHAVTCAIAGRVVATKPKATVRRAALQKRGYGVHDLSNIDFVDAALCAVAAEGFRSRHYQQYGDRREGFIVVPAPSVSIASSKSL